MLDRLYFTNPEAGPQFPIWATLSNSAASASTTPSVSAVNTQQLPFWMTSIAVLLLPGAAQYPTHYQFSIRDPEGGRFYSIGGDQLTLTTAAVGTRVGMMTNLVIPPRWGITVASLFNAGAASNSVQLDAIGWYIPRGSLGLP